MISFESVTQTVEKISAMTIEQTQTLAMQMSEEQPYVLVYLLTACENEAFTNDESELFFFVGSVLWQVMRQNPNGKRQISEKNILNATKVNESLLKKMATDSEGDFFSVSEKIVLNSPEPEVLRYITDSLMEEDDEILDKPSFRDDKLGVAFLHLKIVLDAFISRRKI